MHSPPLWCICKTSMSSTREPAGAVWVPWLFPGETQIHAPGSQESWVLPLRRWHWDHGGTLAQDPVKWIQCQTQESWGFHMESLNWPLIKETTGFPFPTTSGFSKKAWGHLRICGMWSSSDVLSHFLEKSQWPQLYGSCLCSLDK